MFCSLKNMANMADCNSILVLYHILTETSLQIPGIGFGQSSGGQNSPLGCIIRTPLVVKPSTSFSPFSQYYYDISQDLKVCYSAIK